MSTRNLALAAVMVLTAMTRLVPHPWNFAPITAIAVFGGVRYGNRVAALVVPLLALLLSDCGKEILHREGLSPDQGFYHGMLSVYGSIALIALMSRLAQGSRSPAALAGVTLAGSCLFFVLTNFAVWVGSSHYPQTVAGLMECYYAALPFFRNALLGDFFYAGILFGAWAVAEASYPALRPAAEPVTA